MTALPAGITPDMLREELNRLSPATSRSRLGDLIVALIASANATLASLNVSMLTKAGLVIKAASSAVVRSANPVVALIAGVPVRKVASDMAALVGTLATAKSAAWAFYISAAGVLTTSAKTADAASHDAALALLTAPPAGLAMIGFIVIDNATGANFVGGTTALDTASLTVTYYDTLGPSPFAATIANVGAPALGTL